MTRTLKDKTRFRPGGGGGNHRTVPYPTVPYRTVPTSSLKARGQKLERENHKKYYLKFI